MPSLFDTTTIKRDLSKSLTIILGILSVAGTLAICLTCLVMMFIGLMFCDNCSGIGDWAINLALPLCGLGAAAIGSTVGGFMFSAGGRPIVGRICLAIVPSLCAMAWLYPSAGNWSALLAVIAWPFAKH